MLVFLVIDALSEKKVREPDVGESSAKRAESSGAFNLVTFVSVSILTKDCLSIARKFLERTTIDVQFAGTVK